MRLKVLVVTLYVLVLLLVYSISSGILNVVVCFLLGLISLSFLFLSLSYFFFLSFFRSLSASLPFPLPLLRDGGDVFQRFVESRPKPTYTMSCMLSEAAH